MGLLRLEYDGIEKLVKHAYITEIPELADKSEDQRYDYIRGILDIFRWAGAIGNVIFDDTVNKYENWASKIREDLLFDINRSRSTCVGFAFEMPKEKHEIYDKRQRIEFKSMLGTNSTLVNWTRRFFGIKDNDDAKEILEKVLNVLIKANFITEFWTNASRNPGKKRTYKLYHIREKKILFNLNPLDEHQYCPKCQKVYYFKEFGKCISINCPSLKHVQHKDDHFYLNMYKQLPDKEKELHAREHSAQLEGKLREQFETSFKDNTTGSINVLVCTPTMELGIDIGDLSAIIMRNVPPDPSRYAQRAGRAGRNNQPSIITVFCGTGINRGPHDQYFYREPEKIVSGKIQPPNFLLDNKKLIRRHINSIIFENLDLKISKSIGDLLKLDDPKNDYPMFLEVKKDFKISYLKILMISKRPSIGHSRMKSLNITGLQMISSKIR